MDDFDRFWQWADKSLENTLAIPADIHHAITSLPPEARRDRGKVNEAARLLRKTGGENNTATPAVRSPFNVACWHETTRRADLTSPFTGVERTSQLCTQTSEFDP